MALWAGLLVPTVALTLVLYGPRRESSHRRGNL